MKNERYEEILNNVVKNIVDENGDKSISELVSLLCHIGFGLDAKDCLKLYFENKKKEAENYFDAKIESIDKIDDKNEEQEAIKEEPVQVEIAEEPNEVTYKTIEESENSEVTPDDLFNEDKGVMDKPQAILNDEVIDESPPARNVQEEDRILSDEEILSELFGDESQ